MNGISGPTGRPGYVGPEVSTLLLCLIQVPSAQFSLLTLVITYDHNSTCYFFA